MQIIPGQAPASATVQTGLSSSQKDARARAISILQGGTEPKNPSQVSNVNQAQQLPVPNASQVSPEDAIKTTQQVQQDNIEAAPEAPKEATTSQEEPLSTQYAILARKEKQLRARVQQQEQAIKAREAALLAREDALKAKDSEYESKYVPKDRITKDPLTVLSELGLSSEQITQLALNAPSQEALAHKAEIESLRAEIRSLVEKQDGVSKSLEERDNQAEQQVINQMTLEAQQLVATDPEFETIKATGNVKEVVKLIQKVFKEDGIILSVEEAAKEVEDALVDRAITYAKLSKIQKRLGTQAQPAAQATTESPKQSQPVKTLTNNISASRPLSARQRAIMAFEGKLNK